ncbi:hypothetical protein ISS07_04715 [Candidatus Woesearchaeota archaeon]|nr:hypothetical protein [Candidatus Woesearchaeota archaeon]
MDKIKWCVKKGLSMIEPNRDLANAYTQKAEEALQSVPLNKVKDWKISTAYYSVYFSLYSILTRMGIKCEIHSCTLEFAKKFLKDYFNKEDFEFMETSLKSRIDSQYYTDRTVPDEDFDKLIKESPGFFVKCKSILDKLKEVNINKIRDQFRKDLD